MSETPPEEPRAEVPDVDLGQVAADDALLDALGRGQTPPPSHPDSDPIATLLTAFRAGLDEQAASIPTSHEVPAEVTALPTLTPVAPAPTRHRRWTRRAAAVAVVGGVLVSGTGVAAALTAQPGDLLYGVRRAVVGPVDDRYRKDASALVDQTAKLSTGKHPIGPAVQAQILDHAADLVAGIKDPGRKKAMVRKIASARVALGLPSQPIQTDGTPLATPGPATDISALGPAPAASPTASPTPSPDDTASGSPSVALGTGSPSGSPSPSGPSSGSPSSSGAPASSASASASSSRQRHSPSPSPSGSTSASGTPSASTGPSSSSPTYRYVPPPPPRRPRPKPSPTFIIG